MRKTNSKEQSSDLAKKRARRETKQPYATELEDREVEKAQVEESSQNGDRPRRPHRRGAAV